MPQNQQYDALQFDQLFFPYNRIEAELSQKPRLIRGYNAYITMGGKLAKRPGTLEVTNFGLALRPDRIMIYETLESPPKLYLVASFYNSGTSLWGAYYNRPAANTGWVSMGSTRSLNASTAPQEFAISRGLCYVKSFPASGSSDKYGTAIFDGSGTSVNTYLWGLPAPTEPVHISGRVTLIGSDIDSVSTSLTVSANFSPAVTAPFNITVEYEVMTVTSTGGGTNWTVSRGVNGTTAASHPAGIVVIYKDWSASTHRIVVNYGWKYTYAWVSPTGQVSNRAPLETNYDKMPSVTGPFFNLIPKINVTGNADTTNITKINIYRSTDGGGTFFKLDSITNTGAGLISYLDDTLVTGSSGGTQNDPIPDSSLDQGNIAPSLTSNSAPPTVLAPLVLGTDIPAQSSPVTSYAGRLWYGIGNYLFYSAQEELNEGVPEESWPTGIAGNYFKIQYPILNVTGTNNALYIFTLQQIFAVTGTNLETFNVRPLFENLGVPYGHPRAVARYGDKVVFLSHDFRIVVIQGDDDPLTVSDPLFTDIIDQLNLDTTNMEVDIKYWGDLEKEWIIVAIHDKSNPLLSKQWVFDLKLTKKQQEPFWFVPWTLPTVALYSGRVDEKQSQRRLCFFIYDPTVPYGRLVRLDPTGRVATDTTVGTNTVSGAGTSGYDFRACTHLHLVPPGNHVNALRQPTLSPVVQYISIERTFIPADEDPDIYYYKDDFWSDPINIDYIEDPARRDLSKSYKTIQAHINEVAYRFAFELQKVNSGNIIEIQNYCIVWDSDAGDG